MDHTVPEEDQVVSELEAAGVALDAAAGGTPT